MRRTNPIPGGAGWGEAAGAWADYAEQTQFAGGRGERQVLSRKRVMTISACRGLRKNKANFPPGQPVGKGLARSIVQNKANSGRSLRFEGASVKIGKIVLEVSNFTHRTRAKAVRILIALRGPRADNPAGAE
jgi:hypothetical protein